MNEQKIKSIVHIKDEATGIIHQYKESGSVWLDDDGDYNFYMWSMGNYSCDCNREIFFNNAVDKDSDIDNLECGDQIRYAVNIEIDGEIVYQEYKTGTPLPRLSRWLWVAKIQARLWRLLWKINGTQKN